MLLVGVVAIVADILELLIVGKRSGELRRDSDAQRQHLVREEPLINAAVAIVRALCHHLGDAMIHSKIGRSSKLKCADIFATESVVEAVEHIDPYRA